MWNLYHRPWQPAKDIPPPYVDNVRTELKSPGQVSRTPPIPHPIAPNPHLFSRHSPSRFQCSPIFMTLIQPSPTFTFNPQVYFDRAAGEVYYVPLPGQDMTKASAIVAVEEQLVAHSGTAQHLWHGVVFEYATWLRPMQGDGFVEQQSAACNVCPMGASNGQPPFAPGCGEGDVSSHAVCRCL